MSTVTSHGKSYSTHCSTVKKNPLFIDGITININGNSLRNNSHLNRIIEDQKPNLKESGVYIYY